MQKKIIPQINTTYFVIDSQYVPEGLLSSIVPIQITKIDIIEKIKPDCRDRFFTVKSKEYHCQIIGEYALHEAIVNIDWIIIVNEDIHSHNIWYTKEDAFKFMRNSFFYTTSK